RPGAAPPASPAPQPPTARLSVIIYTLVFTRYSKNTPLPKRRSFFNPSTHRAGRRRLLLPTARQRLPLRSHRGRHADYPELNPGKLLSQYEYRPRLQKVCLLRPLQADQPPLRSATCAAV